MFSKLVTLSFIASAYADLRMASQPKSNWKVRNRGGAKRFVETGLEFSGRNTAAYMEPDDFGYAKLKAQRRNNYDNFLRSNIDNEQDRQNFYDEDGKDHLPFRTYESAAVDDGNTDAKKQLKALKADFAWEVKPGVKTVVPLRWNNPHASELEVNIWLNNDQGERKIVVPIRKPTCSGEGHQDNSFSFTIPDDFKDLGAKVPGFKGCNKAGDCVLQIYAHSVESRTYAIGTPIIVPGHDATKTVTGFTQIQPATTDPLLDLSGLRQLCLPSNDPSANIANAVPRHARLVSDVYGHAYQDSDYSSYGGQQHEAISQNMQAACIIKGVTGNRGELGKSILPSAANTFRKRISRSSIKLIKKYESLANRIIKSVLDKDSNALTKDTIANAPGLKAQETKTCFRCAEDGAVKARRLTTNTYVPSFTIPAANLAAAKKYVPSKYSKLIDENGTLQIYVTVLQDMAKEFKKAAEKYELYYQPAKVKTTTTTMADATNFKKRDANGNKDNGKYAATEAKKKAAADAAKAKADAEAAAAAIMEGRPMYLPLEAVDPVVAMPALENNTPEVEDEEDMDGIAPDGMCDNDIDVPSCCHDDDETKEPDCESLSAGVSSSASVATVAALISAVFVFQA